MENLIHSHTFNRKQSLPKKEEKTMNDQKSMQVFHKAPVDPWFWLEYCGSSNCCRDRKCCGRNVVHRLFPSEKIKSQYPREGFYPER